MGGRTDMTQLIVIFHNFENAPKKLKIPSKWHGLEFQCLLFYKPGSSWKENGTKILQDTFCLLSTVHTRLRTIITVSISVMNWGGRGLAHLVHYLVVVVTGLKPPLLPL
jgi:hypothetical protein